jgi:hypothetical protein
VGGYRRAWRGRYGAIDFLNGIKCVARREVENFAGRRITDEEVQTLYLIVREANRQDRRRLRSQPPQRKRRKKK